MPHKGGLKLDPDSEEYRLLSQWIANGAARPSDNDPPLTRIEVRPRRESLAVGESQQLCVHAVYGDGPVEDVTRWARFTSTLSPVIDVDESGKAKVVGQGEASVVVWFSSQLAVSTIASPFDFKIADAIYDNAPKRNFIDELVLEKLQSLNLVPSPRCDDATFIRRAFLDTIGMLPSVAEASFPDRHIADKRDQLIDALLQREEFVDYWTYRWSDVFLINGKRLRPASGQSLLPMDP